MLPLYGDGAEECLKRTLARSSLKKVLLRIARKQRGKFLPDLRRGVLKFGCQHFVGSGEKSLLKVARASLLCSHHRQMDGTEPKGCRHRRFLAARSPKGP